MPSEIVDFGLAWITALQSFRNASLDLFFISVTWAGDYRAFILLLPLLWWTRGRRLGFPLAIAAVAVGITNTLLKEWFQELRPFEVSGVTAIVAAKGYSFPSGHSQFAAALWLTLLFEERKLALTVGALCLILLSGISRTYLGVHYPSDVVAGWILGTATALLIRHFKSAMAVVNVQRGLLLLSALAVVVMPHPDILRAFSLLLGILTAEWGLRYLPERQNQRWIMQLIGMTLIAAAYLLARFPYSPMPALPLAIGFFVIGFLLHSWPQLERYLLEKTFSR